MLKDSPAFVYILAHKAKGQAVTYVGWTLDLEARLEAHLSGQGAKFTRGRRWRLIYAERLPGKRQAMSREVHLKRDRRLRALIRSNL